MPESEIVFGVNECSPVLDSYSAMDAMSNKEDLLSLNPTLFGSIPNEVGSYLAWTVENLEGSKFNSFALHTGESAQCYGFSMYGRYESVDEYRSMLFMTDPTLPECDRKAWPVPVGVAGFKQLKFEVDAVANTDVVTNAYILQFCKSLSTGSCPAMGEYPSVGEGEISPAGCPEGFRGYAYRECHDGVLGEAKMDKLPDRLQYENNNMVFVMEFLFNEELGLVVDEDETKMAKTQAANRVSVSVNGAVVLDEDEKALHDLWEATSFELDKLQSNPACAEQEQEGLKKRHKPAWKLTYEPRATPAEWLASASKYRVAIIREEGSNGEYEVVVRVAGFEP